MVSRKNQWLADQGFTIQGFVAGDADLRGPLYQGLPTLEKHRGVHPLAAALELAECKTDLIYIGDAGLSERVQQQFATYQNNRMISLQVEVLDEELIELVLGTHVNRQDEARDVIRSADARFKKFHKFHLSKRLNERSGALRSTMKTIFVIWVRFN